MLRCSSQEGFSSSVCDRTRGRVTTSTELTGLFGTGDLCLLTAMLELGGKPYARLTGDRQASCRMSLRVTLRLSLSVLCLTRADVASRFTRVSISRFPQAQFHAERNDSRNSDLPLLGVVFQPSGRQFSVRKITFVEGGVICVCQDGHP